MFYVSLFIVVCNFCYATLLARSLLKNTNLIKKTKKKNIGYFFVSFFVTIKKTIIYKSEALGPDQRERTTLPLIGAFWGHKKESSTILENNEPETFNVTLICLLVAVSCSTCGNYGWKSHLVLSSQKQPALFCPP